MRRFLSTVLGIFLFHIASLIVEAQDQETLSVTATVVTSVALVTDAGAPRIVIANPSARNDNLSSVSDASSTIPKGKRNAGTRRNASHSGAKSARESVPSSPVSEIGRKIEAKPAISNWRLAIS